MGVKVGQRIDPVGLNLLEDWGTYTPELRAVTTNPNLGNAGQAVGSWWRHGRRIRGFARFLFSGTGVDPGSGGYRISLPFLVDPDLNSIVTTGGRATILGTGRIRDDDTAANSRIVFGMAGEADAISLQRDASNATITNSAPFTWAAGDRISLNFSYLADPADLPEFPVNNRRLAEDLVLPSGPMDLVDYYDTYPVQLIAATADPDLGEDPEAFGWFHRSGRWITGHARFKFSTGLDVGSGSYRITLPYPADPELVQGSGVFGAGSVIGDGRCRDHSAGGNSTQVSLHLLSADPGVVFMGPETGNSSINHSNTIPWANNDRISVRFAYPADPAHLPD